MGTVCSEESNDLMEETLCSSEELEEGQMLEREMGGAKVLLLRDEEGVRAFSGTCTHYGAPLAKGDLRANRIVCPWHGACFNATTGDIEDFPGLDSLLSYSAEEKDGNIVVRASKAELALGRRQRRLARCPKGAPTVLVVGGGAAGHSAIETLRTEGFEGKIVLVSGDSSLPYDRPSLSKKPGGKVANILLRTEDWYKEAGVEIWLNSTVKTIHHEDKAVELATGKRIAYDQLLLATGGGPRRLAVPGEEDLSGVVTLRTPADAAFIAEHSVGKNVVIIGSSFIGMELAAAIAEKAGSVTVVDRNKIPFLRSLGPELGRIIAGWHKEKGVKFVGDDSVREFIGEDGLELSEVLLESDTRLPATLAVVGAGVVPNTDLAKTVDGLDMDERGNIMVDEHMATSVPGIWAAGDIVLFPLVLYDSVLTNLGHWGLASYLGKVAALNLMGRTEQAATVPFFWTVHYGKSVRFAGHRLDGDSVEVEHGSDGKFLAVYSQNEVVTAVATFGRDPVAAHFANLVRNGETLAKEDAFDYFRNISP